MRYRCNMSATEQAYAYAKERILDGRFAGGELISEGDVATGVGLSRTPVREAFLRLESEGLLRLYPKRGALVVPVSAAEVHAVMETRLLVERFAVEKSMPAPPDLRDAAWRFYERACSRWRLDGFGPASVIAFSPDRATLAFAGRRIGQGVDPGKPGIVLWDLRERRPRVTTSVPRS